MDLLLYSTILLFIGLIAFINQYIINKNVLTTEISNLNNNRIIKKKTPIINISIITVILTTYSANLAVSGKLSDTVRYAWSFLYRYPLFTDNIEQIFTSKIEPGFLIFNMLVLKITSEPFWIFFIIALITTFINIYSISKLSKYYTVTIILYLISLYFFQTTYLLRQTIAVSIGNLGYLSYLKGNNWRPYIYATSALLFHYTALILLPFILLVKYGKTVRTYVNLLVIFIVLFLFYETILTTIIPKIPFVSQYTESSIGALEGQKEDTTSGQNNILIILKGIPFYFITYLAIIKRGKLKKHLFNADFYIMSSIFYSLSVIMSYNIYWFFRIGMYFMLPTLALIPSLFSTIKNPKERLLYYFILFFMLIILTYRQIYGSLS